MNGLNRYIVGYYSVIKTNESLPFVKTWMYLLVMYYAKWNMSDKQINILSHLYVESKKKEKIKRKKGNRSRFIGIENKLMVAKK